MASWRGIPALLALVLAACGGGSESGKSIPVAQQPATSCQTAPAALHVGRNTLLVEGDALSIRAFTPYFSSATPPVFSFPYLVPGTVNPHPFDVTTDASGRLYAVIFDDTVSGIAIYNRVPSCVNASVVPDSILGGPQTGIDRAYSVAIDKLGRIYVASVRNDGESEISIFAAGSTGDVAPMTTIRGLHTLLGSQTASAPGFTKSVRVDANLNIYASNSIGQIVVFPAGSSGDAPPSRVIAGSNTHLVDPTIALGPDASIYAANFEGQSITVYAPDANGNVTPVRMISGDQTRLRFPREVAVCSDGLFYVASSSGVLAFYPGSNGNVSPGAVVLGGNSGVFQPLAVGF